MMYKRTDIGSLVTLRQGFAINKKTNHHMSDTPTNLHLLRIGDMKDDCFSIYVKDTIPEKFIAKESDVIYTRTGQVGLVFRKQHGVVHNNCFTVTSNDEEVLYQPFIYYVLQEKSFYEEAISRATGAAQPDLPHGAFNSIQIYLPPVDKQIKITEILDAYNDLIENNQKQIKLLEEAAQRLYKEWFVDLRFPGYEDTPIVDGVPEGWEITVIKSVADLKAGGDKPTDFSEIMTNEYSIPVYANGIFEKGLMGYTNKSVINQPSVTISARGTVGVVFLRREPYMPIVRLISVTPKEDIMDELYLYLFLDNQNFRSTGAAQQQITIPLLKDKEIVCPSNEIRKKFYEVVLPIFDKIDVLTKQNDKLIEARDRLLPKLMNGEIEV